MKRKELLYCLFCTLFFSCGNDNTKNIDRSNLKEQITVLGTVSLKLNKGQKWLVNLETDEGIHNMDSIIRHFNLQEEKDYVALGEKLSKQTSYVIKNCNMTGQGHDQLHVVLVPMLDQIYELRESNNVSKSERILYHLEGLLLKYFEYFKLK